MTADLESRIRRCLRDDIGVDDGGLAVDASLITSGLVDSAGLVRLAAVLERDTGLLIPDRDLTPEHFDSIARILAYVAAARP
jgi:acyl carrier protein